MVRTGDLVFPSKETSTNFLPALICSVMVVDGDDDDVRLGLRTGILGHPDDRSAQKRKQFQ